MNVSVVTNREICRLCAGMHSKSNMTFLFAKNDPGRCLLERIHKYTPFKINADDCLSKFVCIICTNHIDHWHNFLELCLNAQENIILSLKKSQDTVDVTKGEVSTHSVGDRTRVVTQPTINKVVDNASNQENVSSQGEHHEVLLDVSATVKQTLNTCSAPDSTVGENVFSAAVQAKKANSDTNTRRNYCIARWCNNSTKCNPSLSLFRVPKNRNRAVTWLENAEREDLKHLDLKILYTKFLCSKHFTEDMFTNSTRNRLVWNAVPTLFPKPHYADKMKQIQANAALQRMAIEMVHSSLPTRIMPKPECKSTTSLPLSAERVIQTTVAHKAKEKPIDVTQSELNVCENISVTELLSSTPEKSAKSSGKSVGENTIASADAPPHSSFLADSMCSFQESHEPVFPCRYCGEMFLVKSSLILHQTTYHPEHSVGCEQCGKVNYTSKSEFMGHLCDHAETAMDQM